MGYERDIADTLDANIRACKEARRKHNLVPVEDVTAIDCNNECAIHMTECPFVKMNAGVQ